MYYDGQGFLVRRSLGAKAATDLTSGSICVQQETTTELNLIDFFRQRGLKYEAKTFPTQGGDGKRLQVRQVRGLPGLNELWTHGGLLYAAPIQ